jgi:hypothetical protein
MRRIDVMARMIEEAFAARRKSGTVTAIVGTKVRVTVDNGSMDLPRLASYTPTVGDVVQIDAMVSGSWLVIGKAA